MARVWRDGKDWANPETSAEFERYAQEKTRRIYGLTMLVVASTMVLLAPTDVLVFEGEPWILHEMIVFRIALTLFCAGTYAIMRRVPVSGASPLRLTTVAYIIVV